MAEMRPAAEMKDSGIEWIRSVPKEWKISRTGNYFYFNSGDSLTNEMIVDDKRDGYFPVYGANGVRGYYTNKNLNGKHILLGRVGALCGNVHIVDEPVWVTEHALIAKKRKLSNDEYYGYVFESMDLIQYSKASAQPVISASTLTGLRIPVPSMPEQQAIADYLDDRCSRIDEIIAEATASIEDYQKLKQAVIREAVTKGLDKNVSLKKSGIEWLPYVPEHWDVRRIATIYDESKETGRDDLPILLVSIHTGISDREIDNEERDRKVIRSEDKTIYKVVHKNYLAYNMMRAWQGGFGAAAIDGLVSPAYVVAKPKIEVNSAYIENVLRTPNAIEHIRGMSYGVADFRLRLYWPYFKNIRVPLPSIEEQNRIVEYIKNHVLKFDSLISEKQSLISDLQAYKKSLIYEVVTGKRRVV